MVRTVARSRGCRICRKRRIKCDESFPECTQCKRNGKKCPGPITGTFYIIASEACTVPHSSVSGLSKPCQSSGISKSNHHSPNSNSSIEASKPTVHSTPPTVNTPIPCTLNVPSLIESSNDVFLPILPSWYQPSRAEAFDQLFFSHFFDACGSGVETIGACSWIGKLRDRMATSFSSLALAYSTRATVMAFYGLLVGEVPIQTEARRTYARALENQRADMGRDATPKQQDSGQNSTSEEAICTTVMMCYFELIIKTTPLAWVQHLDAAVAMLVTLGPEACRFGFLHQLFRTVRLAVGFSSVGLKTPHCFAQERWKTIPFQGPKLQLDETVDVILSIPEYIFLADGMAYMTSAFDLQGSLQAFRTGLSFLISNLDNQVRNVEELPANINPPLTAYCDDGHSSQPILYSDRRTGCVAAIRHAAYLICFSLLAKMGTESEAAQAKAAQHSEAILGAVEYVDTCTPSAAGGLYMSTVFSLHSLLQWSPSPRDKAYALQKMEISAAETFQ